ncbi:MAG: TIGR00730 family Rossman fold protein [Hyphomicrobiales bacterium]
MKKICVFCGSSLGKQNIYKETANELALFMAKNKIDLIYGGANVGVMKVIADTIMDNGGKAIGIMPKLLVEKEVAHEELDEMHIVSSMAERKELMIEMSDAFIALPGGFGTLDEISEVLTANQLRISDKPIGLLNIDNFFTPLLNFIDHCVSEGFVRKEHRRNIIVSSEIDDLIDKMDQYQPLSMGKWIDDIKQESSSN